jgi:hypothetical protein
VAVQSLPQRRNAGGINAVIVGENKGHR